ncbi:MAG: YjhX family toxin [Boseongicola sp.]|nr:YjhX family toxin [Boseongicola sp.]MDD9978191.1 YjhX family toxin [Boseongicola sp.]
MNISKHEQRVLHVLAQGGAIHFERQPNGKIRKVTCFTRDGHALETCTLAVFERLKKRRLVQSRSGKPYRITRNGLLAVRAQLDNRS